MGKNPVCVMCDRLAEDAEAQDEKWLEYNDTKIYCPKCPIGAVDTGD